MERFTVSRDEAIYEAFPDVIDAADGTLVCVFTECTHHRDRTGARLCLSRSRDGGRTWSPKTYLTEPGTKEANYNCARLSRLPDGRLVLVCDFVTRPPEGERSAVVRMWISRDGGETWDGPEDTPAEGIVPDRIVVLDTGRWLLAAHFDCGETGKLAQYVWYTDDEGKTWSPRITVASDPRYKLCEASMLPLGGGDVVCFMRENSGQGRDGLKAISHDGGETWEGVYPVPIPGMYRPTAGFLPDGRILITFRFHPGGPGGLGIWCMTNGAVTDAASALETERKKQRVRQFPLELDRSPVSDTGYTGWVRRENGEIVMVNYLVDDAEKAWIRASVFRIGEFLL